MIAVNSQFISNDRLPPMNMEAEESILGAILLDPNAINNVADILPLESLSLRSHRLIYQAMMTLRTQRKPTDLMSVTSYLYDNGLLESVGGQHKLAQLVDRTVSSVNVDQYANLVIDKYQRRRLIELGSEISSLGYETATELYKVLSEVQEKTFDITQSISLAGGLKDVEEIEHKQLIAQIADIELTVEDPSLRQLKLLRLASKFKLSINQLETIYFKSLLNDENEPAMNLASFREKYGNSVHRWLLHGFLAEGKVSLLYGKGGIGKTRLAYDFVYHLVTGASWNGFPVTAKKRSCLIIQTDESQGDMLQALYDRGFSDEMPVWYKSRWTVDHIQQLDKELETLKPELVVIDSITSVNINSVVSENDVAYARFILLLKALAQKHGSHIILIHHANGEGKPRGTSAIVNAVSDVICIAATNDQRPGSLERVLKIEKSRSRAPGIYELLYNPEDNSWSCLGKQGESESNSSELSLKDKIVDFLQARPNTIYEASEIHEGIGGSIDSVRRCATVLARDGIINCKRLGKANGYWISVDGHQPPSYTPPDREALAKVKAELRKAAHDQEDQEDDQLEDQLGNTDRERAVDVADHLIIKNEISTIKKTPENSKNDDQMISNAQEVSCVTVTPTDPPSDPPSDHGDQIAITSDDENCFQAEVIDARATNYKSIGIVLGHSLGLYRVQFEGSDPPVRLYLENQLRLINPPPVEATEDKVPEPEPEPEKQTQQLNLLDQKALDGEENAIATGVGEENAIAPGVGEENAIASFEVGDRIELIKSVWASNYGKELGKVEPGVVIGVGEKYIAIDLDIYKDLTYSVDATYIRHAVSQESSAPGVGEENAIAPGAGEENAIATPNPQPDFKKGQRVRWNGYNCLIIKLWKHKAKVEGYDSNHEFIKNIVPLSELKEV